MNDSTKRVLIVNLSGDQKKVLGFASWMQVSITAGGIFVGVILYTLVYRLLQAMGAGTGVSLIFGAIFFVAVVAPLAYVAFKPVRDKHGNLLYYQYKQLLINYSYERDEIGSYLNIQPKLHSVNADLPYRPKFR